MFAYIANVRIPLQFDIGFGDSIFPEATLTEYPTLLGQPSPKLKIYSRYSVIAEKFEAMVNLGMGNSRLKDFYDIWLLSMQFDFEYTTLQNAINHTFSRRDTLLPVGKYPLGLTAEFGANPTKQIQWEAFCKKTNPKDAPQVLSVAIERIRIFLEPVIFTSSATPTQWRAGNGWQ